LKRENASRFVWLTERKNVFILPFSSMICNLSTFRYGSDAFQKETIGE